MRGLRRRLALRRLRRLLRLVALACVLRGPPALRAPVPTLALALVVLALLRAAPRLALVVVVVVVVTLRAGVLASACVLAVRDAQGGEEG